MPDCTAAAPARPCPAHSRSVSGLQRGAGRKAPILSRIVLALAVLAAAPALPRAAAAQDGSGSVAVLVVSEGEPVPGARVSSGSVAAESGADGRAVLRLPAGTREIRVEALGLGAEQVDVTIRAGEESSVTVSLEIEGLEVEEIIVSTTRTDRRIEDVPMRIEVIGREEVEEKLLMTPGDISMLLNETAGLRVQPTAPALGGAGVRIQGLRGRYTQILSDGLPLYGGQTGAFGPLQIPPMDLAQVEVIKGAVSALYGASALGGVVNLISRRPEEAREGELLLNQGTLGGTDVISWNSGPLSGRWGYTLLGGFHRQSMSDVDGDGWADLSGFRRVTARPRLFWNDGRGSSTLLTVGATIEEREGGTLDGASSIPTGTPWKG